MFLKSFLVGCIVALCAACAARPAPSIPPRPQPGYLNLLERQSMVYQANDLIAQVSQTERVWMNNGLGGRIDVLLNAAPVWLELNGYANPAKENFFQFASSLSENLKKAGIGGLYLGPMMERQNIWLQEGRAPEDENYGRTAASLAFASVLGSSEDYDALAAAAEKTGLELGGDLLPGATDPGPDFLLQARNAVGHAGLYAMIAVPDDAWQFLPPAEKEWDLRPLSSESLQELRARGILPAALSRDSFTWSNTGGWAATGPVSGVDGKPRRWVYRYHVTPNEPVLLWQDPSGLAQKLFAADIIWQTGLLGQTLVGLRAGAMFGLEPGGGDFFSPGTGIINALTSQIHRYGGWVLQADPLPSAGIEKTLAGPCDFCVDALSPALVAYALATRDVAPLVALYGDWIKKNLNQSRLARNYNLWRGPDFTILKSLPDGDQLADRLAELGGSSIMTAKKGTLTPRGGRVDNFQEFMLKWSLGLPGLVFANAADFFANEDQLMQKNKGMPDFSTITASLSSGNREVSNLIAVRSRLALAEGRLESVTRQNKIVAFISTLPTGGLWLQAANFTPQADVLELTLPRRVKSALAAASGENLVDNLQANGMKFRLVLDGTQVTNVVFELE